MIFYNSFWGVWQISLHGRSTIDCRQWRVLIFFWMCYCWISYVISFVSSFFSQNMSELYVEQITRIAMNLKWQVRGFHYLCILYVLDFDKTGISYGKVSWQQKCTWVMLKWDDINRRVGFFIFFTKNLEHWLSEYSTLCQLAVTY